MTSKFILNKRNIIYSIMEKNEVLSNLILYLHVINDKAILN